MDKETMLIERLKAQVKSGQAPTSAYNWHRQHVRQPVTRQELDHVEAMLGFALPPLLKRVYLETCFITKRHRGPIYRVLFRFIGISCTAHMLLSTPMLIYSASRKSYGALVAHRGGPR